MSPLPLLLAATLASIDPSPSPPAVEPPGVVDPAPIPELRSPPALREERPLDRPGSISGGVSTLRYDGIPVTLTSVRLGISSLRMPPPGEPLRLGFGLFLEGGWGATENGLQTGTLVCGPHLVAAAGPLRGTVGIELGGSSLRRATDGSTALFLTGFFRGALEADLWEFERARLFATLTGSYGGGFDLPFRGWAAFLGLRF